MQGPLSHANEKLRKHHKAAPRPAMHFYCLVFLFGQNGHLTKVLKTACDSSVNIEKYSMTMHEYKTREEITRMGMWLTSNVCLTGNQEYGSEFREEIQIMQEMSGEAKAGV